MGNIVILDCETDSFPGSFKDCNALEVLKDSVLREASRYWLKEKGKKCLEAV